MVTGEPPPRGVATGTDQERGDKMDARYSNLGKTRGAGSLTGPRLKKVPRLNMNTTQRADPPSPQKTECTSQITDICVGIFKMHLRETGQILLV